jgi:S-DNA-T family DNA segregation ATPase FtsK/SpoIIIE
MKARHLFALGALLFAGALGVLLVGGSDLGSLGNATSVVLGGLFGAGAWVFVAVAVGAAWTVGRGGRYGVLRGVGDVALVIFGAVLSDLASDGSGGVVGGGLGDGLRSGLGAVGGVVLLSLVSLLVLAERLDLRRFARRSELRSVRGRARDDEADVADVEDVEDEDVADDFVSVEDGVVDEAPGVSEAAAWESRDEVASFAGAPRANFRQTEVSHGVSHGGHGGVVGPFELPGPGLLSEGGRAELPDVDALRDEAEGLVEALGAYDVEAKAEGVLPGPVVSTFEVSIARGTKFSKVTALAADLSLQIGRKVRVVPSRLGRVGFEVQNEKRGAVSLRGMLEDEGFARAQRRMALPVAVGRDVRGGAVFADLAEMPHLIVAGSTGSGKSVAVNSMLCSLLSARTPEELRLVLVDPKVVELAPYSGVPHLLAPPASDAPGALRALRWCVAEMDRRYGLLAGAGCKNIKSYNDKDHGRGSKLPHIVVVVDELADLMMQAKKEVEPLLGRLGQKARAAGIHLVVATQRPSVDVLTGLVKSNFPSRLGLRVAQGVDSRVILDEQGAEQLLGKGDALFKAEGSEHAARVQCPWVSEEDVEAVCAHLRSQGVPSYEQAIIEDEAPVGRKARRGGEEKVWS